MCQVQYSEATGTDATRGRRREGQQGSRQWQNQGNGACGSGIGPTKVTNGSQTPRRVHPAKIILLLDQQARSDAQCHARTASTRAGVKCGLAQPLVPAAPDAGRQAAPPR